MQETRSPALLDDQYISHSVDELGLAECSLKVRRSFGSAIFQRNKHIPVWVGHQTGFGACSRDDVKEAAKELSR